MENTRCNRTALCVTVLVAVCLVAASAHFLDGHTHDADEQDALCPVCVLGTAPYADPDQDASFETVLESVGTITIADVPLFSRDIGRSASVRAPPAA